MRKIEREEAPQKWEKIAASLVFDATVIVIALLGRITWPEAVLFMFCLTTCGFINRRN
jgi:hypothetical protein